MPLALRTPIGKAKTTFLAETVIPLAHMTSLCSYFATTFLTFWFRYTSNGTLAAKASTNLWYPLRMSIYCPSNSSSSRPLAANVLRPPEVWNSTSLATLYMKYLSSSTSSPYFSNAYCMLLDASHFSHFFSSFSYVSKASCTSLSTSLPLSSKTSILSSSVYFITRPGTCFASLEIGWSVLLEPWIQLAPSSNCTTGPLCRLTGVVLSLPPK